MQRSHRLNLALDRLGHQPLDLLGRGTIVVRHQHRTLDHKRRILLLSQARERIDATDEHYGQHEPHHTWSTKRIFGQIHSHILLNYNHSLVLLQMIDSRRNHLLATL